MAGAERKGCCRPWLPVELISEVLMRAESARDLGRCKCVSKSWRSVIGSPAFSKAYKSRHHHNGGSGLLLSVGIANEIRHFYSGVTSLPPDEEPEKYIRHQEEFGSSQLPLGFPLPYLVLPFKFKERLALARVRPVKEGHLTVYELEDDVAGGCILFPCPAFVCRPIFIPKKGTTPYTLLATSPMASHCLHCV